MTYIDVNRDVVLLPTRQGPLWCARLCLDDVPAKKVKDIENAFKVAASPRQPAPIRYLAMVHVQWYGGARFNHMVVDLRKPGALDGLVILEKQGKNEQDNEWKRRLAKVAARVGPFLWERTRVLADEKQLKKAIKEGNLWE